MTDSSLRMSDQARDFALWSLVPQLLAPIRYCVLASADVEGTPRATPVFFAARGTRELFWVSAPASRHSRNIAARPMIGITVFDSTVPIGAAEALYLEAQAAVVDAVGHAEGLRVLNAKLPQPRALTHADLCNLTDAADDFLVATRFVIMDRDPVFAGAVRSMLAGSGIESVRFRRGVRVRTGTRSVSYVPFATTARPR